MAITAENRTGPLNGIKILDFTRAYAGPFATMLLGDMGATIIKVEQPVTGDTTRSLGPYLDPSTKDYGLGGFNLSVNRNKKSIALNLKDPKAQKIAHQLVKECDAMIFNFSSPKIMEKFNLTYETVSKINPKMVYVSISGYGTDRVVGSMYEGKPTIDLMMQAESGTMSITGSPDGKMYKVGPGIGDSFAGTLSIVALLAALIHARETGEGQFIDIAMLDSMMLLTERIMYQYSYTGVSPGPIGNRHPLQAPYSMYPAKDGNIVLAANPERYWTRFCKASGIAEFNCGDPRFSSNEERIKHQDELDEIITAWTSVRTKAEIMAVLDDNGCLASPVNRAEDLFRSKHVQERQMLVEVEANPVTGQTAKIAGTPLKFEKTPANILRRAPLIGEDSEEILGELGYGEDELRQLISEGAVFTTKATEIG